VSIMVTPNRHSTRSTVAQLTKTLVRPTDTHARLRRRFLRSGARVLGTLDGVAPVPDVGAGRHEADEADGVVVLQARYTPPPRGPPLCHPLPGARPPPPRLERGQAVRGPRPRMTLGDLVPRAGQGQGQGQVRRPLRPFRLPF
jgi:hypothetical protein